MEFVSVYQYFWDRASEWEALFFFMEEHFLMAKR
jgi:hypothetical protein